LLGFEKKVTLLNLPAEDVNYDDLPDVDLFFSSPPYFMAERYEDNPAQSWVRYKTIESWREDFLYVVLKNVWGKIKEGGHMCVNISDIYKGKDRVKICEPMCDFIETLPDANFIGYYGMKMSLRPNTQEDTSSAEELREMTKSNEKATHVEPIWVFRKGEEKKVDNDISDLFE
jgi:DNA modification methylase